MAASNRTPASLPSSTPDVVDARDALDVLGEKVRLLQLALAGLRASPDAVTPRMIDPVIRLAADLRAEYREATGTA